MRWLIALSLFIVITLPGCGADTTPTKSNDFTPLTQIIISSENPSFIANLTSNKFTAEGNFSDLFTRDITSEVVWTSTNTGVATITSNGLATAITPGNTIITATMDGISRTFSLTVTNATINSIVVSPTSSSVPKGLTEQFSAMGTFSDGSTQVMTNSVGWSAVDPGVATIDSTGLATAIGTGQTNITAAFGIKTDTIQLTVTDPVLLSIKVTPDNYLGIPQQLTVKYVATGTFSDGTTPILSTGLTWSSSNSNVATINSSGVAVGSSSGNVGISATQGSVSSTPSTLNITEDILTEIAILPTTPTVSLGSGTLQFRARGILDNKLQIADDITAFVTWSADNGNATISNTAGTEGLATLHSTGSTQVTATSGLVSSPETTLSIQ